SRSPGGWPRPRNKRIDTRQEKGRGKTAPFFHQGCPEFGHSPSGRLLRCARNDSPSLRGAARRSKLLDFQAVARDLLEKRRPSTARPEEGDPMTRAELTEKIAVLKRKKRLAWRDIA